MRIAEGSFRQTRDGSGWVHRLIASKLPVPVIAPPVVARRELAPVDHRDLVYRALLNALILTPEHAENLIRRGLSEEAITANLYASVPTEQRAVEVSEGIAKDLNLTGVPGFYHWRGRWTFKTQDAGFLVPVRDSRGRITGCQVRRDSGEPRYKWFSTGAVSGGAPIHFSHPVVVGRHPHVFITEGPLKADVISELGGVCVVGVPGVGTAKFPASSPERFGSDLRDALPDVKSVRLAFDSDYRTNAAVRAAILRFADRLESAGWRVGVVDWDPSAGKGLDDVLRGGVR
jgi:uncharacterized protein DUF3854